MVYEVSPIQPESPSPYGYGVPMEERVGNEAQLVAHLFALVALL